MKKISKKQAEIKRKLQKVYNIIAESNERRCTGCGRYYNEVPLSFSHIIPRSRRSDLITDINNITFHCLSLGGIGCHEIWENGTSDEKMMLLDYDKNMSYIREVDSEYYELLKLKE